MDKHGKQSQLASIDNSVLSRVAGGGSMNDVFDSWSWAFADPSCRYAVNDAMYGAGWAAFQNGGDVGSAANQAGLDAWNSPACDYLGWF